MGLLTPESLHFLVSRAVWQISGVLSARARPPSPPPVEGSARARPERLALHQGGKYGVFCPWGGAEMWKLFPWKTPFCLSNGTIKHFEEFIGFISYFLSMKYLQDIQGRAEKEKGVGSRSPKQRKFRLAQSGSPKTSRNLPHCSRVERV